MLLKPITLLPKLMQIYLEGIYEVTEGIEQIEGLKALAGRVVTSSGGNGGGTALNVFEETKLDEVTKSDGIELQLSPSFTSAVSSASSASTSSTTSAL
jgi:hypothetical protein